MAIFMRRLSRAGSEWAMRALCGSAVRVTRPSEEVDRVIEAVRAIAAGEG